ncbi:hypothetical protein NFX52_30535, partial [Acidovorax facilis]|uniref:hypothetical protein n=1 Tax=Acidovorax facilis TaxID=12917 RepID=UPI00208F8377
ATLSQRANNAIVATQTASTFFIMPAIFAGHVAQLKMPRLDAYIVFADKQALACGGLSVYTKFCTPSDGKRPAVPP